MAKKKNPSTQKFLPIEEIRDGIAILKDGGMRTVLMVNAINFSLKSRDEQNALLANYQNFVNSLSFPIQIVVQSRTLDLDKYLSDLQTTATNQHKGPGVTKVRHGRKANGKRVFCHRSHKGGVVWMTLNIM